MLRATALLAVLLAPGAVLGACGGRGDAPKAASPAPAGGPTPTQGAAADGAGELGEDAPDPETPQQIYARVEADLVACYERGRRAAPQMTAGRVTMNIEVDRAGRPACVVASDDTGLTQEVEDCITARIAREAFRSNGASWSTEVPIEVRGGKLGLGRAVSAAPSIETVETHGLPDSAHDVVEALLPRLHACTEGNVGRSELRVMHVGARVARDGKVECAVASSPSPIPARVRSCAAGVLASARFPAPRSAFGLVSVPVKVLGRR